MPKNKYKPLPDTGHMAVSPLPDYYQEQHLEAFLHAILASRTNKDQAKLKIFLPSALFALDYYARIHFTYKGTPVAHFTPEGNAITQKSKKTTKRNSASQANGSNESEWRVTFTPATSGSAARSEGKDLMQAWIAHNKPYICAAADTSLNITTPTARNIKIISPKNKDLYQLAHEALPEAVNIKLQIDLVDWEKLWEGGKEVLITDLAKLIAYFSFGHAFVEKNRNSDEVHFLKDTGLTKAFLNGFYGSLQTETLPKLDEAVIRYMAEALEIDCGLLLQAISQTKQSLASNPSEQQAAIYAFTQAFLATNEFFSKHLHPNAIQIAFNLGITSAQIQQCWLSNTMFTLAEVVTFGLFDEHILYAVPKEKDKIIPLLTNIAKVVLNKDLSFPVAYESSLDANLSDEEDNNNNSTPTVKTTDSETSPTTRASNPSNSVSSVPINIPQPSVNDSDYVENFQRSLKFAIANALVKSAIQNGGIINLDHFNHVLDISAVTQDLFMRELTHKQSAPTQLEKKPSEGLLKSSETLANSSENSSPSGSFSSTTPIGTTIQANPNSTDAKPSVAKLAITSVEGGIFAGNSKVYNSTSLPNNQQVIAAQKVTNTL